MSCLRRDGRFVQGGAKRNAEQDNAEAMMEVIDEALAKKSAKKETDDQTKDRSEPVKLSRDKVLELKLEKANCLIKLKRLKEALSIYVDCFDESNLNADRLKSFVDVLCQTSKQSKKCSSDKGSKDESKADSNSALPKQKADAWSCCSCLGVPFEPVTLPCGHVCCKKCLQKTLTSANPHCDKCGAKLKSFHKAPVLPSNVLVSKLCQKYWSIDLAAVEFKNQGNRLCQEGKVEEAVKAYTQGLELIQNDHFLWGNRSQAFLTLGQAEMALADASKAVEIKPTWAKGHFRKAVALQRLDRHHEAFQSFYFCLVLEEGSTRIVRSELKNSLYFILTKGKVNKRKLSGTLMRTVNSDPSLLSTLQRHMRYAEAEEDYDSGNSDNEDEGLDTSEKIRCREHKLSLSSLMDQTMRSAELLVELLAKTQDPRPIDPSLVDKEDFECPLCFRLFYTPITTPCGHTFCKICLDRTLDHSTDCPMCKASLTQFLAERRDVVDEFIDEAIKRLLPDEAQERQRISEKELEELTGSDIPIFVCTMSFPNIPCPLHVFEPRYRLMIRRCMETGVREFGMCSAVDDDSPFADYGTILEVRDIQYFPDGRAVVDTVGSRRFKVLRRGVRDGYNTAHVEYIRDRKLDCDSIEELKTLHDAVLEHAIGWFNAMSTPIREGILAHYGPIPEVENAYWDLPNGPAWTWWIIAILPLDPHGQIQILSQTALKRRLEGIQRILRYLSRNTGR